MDVFIVAIPNKKERNRNVRIRNAFGEFFGFHSNLVEGLNGVKRVA